MKIVVFIIAIFIGKFAQGQEVIESDVRINTFVNGTLLQPKNAQDTIAIIIGGSGPTDRNGNQRTSQNNSLKKLAQGLSNDGIATFRYDKRIFALIQQNALVEEKISFDDFVNDAIAVIDYFNTKGFSTIILVGHSQGALIATLAAQKRDVDMLVCIAGAGQTIDKVIVDQLALQAPGLVDNATQAFTDLKQKGKSEKFNIGLVSIFRPSVQPFMKTWMRYDPATELSKISIPILLVNGSKDLQVNEKEGEILKNSNPKAKSIHVKDMNHVLKIIEGDDLENSKSYNESYRPVATELIEHLVTFIKS
tara:strand:+ start:2728 stop:3648 length:921 start_codon:yes stop_codon:yes gene_type:complete